MGTENDGATIMASVDSATVDDSSESTGMADLDTALDARRRALAQLTVTNSSDDETVIVPDGALTEMAELAWSHEDSVVPDPVPQHSLRSLVRWSLAITALLVTAAAVAWLGTDFYHEEESPSSPSMVPSLTTTPTVKPAPPPTRGPMPAPTTAPVPTSAPISPSPPAHHEVPPPPAPAAPSAPGLPAPPAHAYDTYLQLLARDGIASTDSPEEMRDNAYWACLELSTGDINAFNSRIKATEKKNPSLSSAQVRAMFADAVDAYCPEYANE